MGCSRAQQLSSLGPSLGELGQVTRTILRLLHLQSWPRDLTQVRVQPEEKGVSSFKSPE